MLRSCRVCSEQYKSLGALRLAELDSPQNPIAVTDGTPIATTNIVASDVANSNAFLSPEGAPLEMAAEASGTPAPAQAGQVPTTVLGADIGMGAYTVDGVKADLWSMTVPYSRQINDRSSIVGTLPFTITNFKDVFKAHGGIGSAKVYGEGINAGWCYNVYDKQDNVPYRWKVTPGAGIYLRQSDAINMGSWVYNVGISSSFAFPLAGGWIANIGDSLTVAWSTGYSDYPDPIRDQQQVTINGVQVFKKFGRWMAGAMVIDTMYFKTNLIPDYQTYAVTAGFMLTPTRSLRFSVGYDDARSYHSLSGKFGSTWKF